MMDKDTTDIVARVIKAGALRCNLWALGEVLSSYQEKCKVQEDDDIVTKVFKYFIVYGRIADICGLVGLTQDKVSDILFFKQCGDMDLTLMAKYIYSISGTKFNDFLKLQVKVILEQGEIDIKKEYTDWKMDGWKEDVEAGNISRDEILREIERIEF